MTHAAPSLLQAPAKLNLTLDVLNRRPDGYHELDMLNLRVTLFDTLEFSPAPITQIKYTGMPAPPNDIVHQAITCYADFAGKRFGAKVRVHKRIPAEAGLGGGSADAAAVLLALQRAYQALDDAALHEAACRVGADVPYCLHDVPCRTRGIGEKLEPLAMPPDPLWFLIVKPAAGISTAALFASLTPPLPHPLTDAAQAALLRGDKAALGALIKNALEPAATALLPEIGALRARLMRLGAHGAAMTGSGSAVFGLFETEAAARAAAESFADAAFLSVCRSMPPG